MKHRLLCAVLTVGLLGLPSCSTEDPDAVSPPAGGSAGSPDKTPAPPKQPAPGGAGDNVNGKTPDGGGEKNTNATANRNPALLDPSLATEKAPAKFRVEFKTSAGDFTVESIRSWAPLGSDRFYNLVKCGFFEDIAFFRVMDGFMVQFGIHGDPKVTTKWMDARLEDEPVRQPNARGMLSFAAGGPNTRTTQMFINFVDNRNLDDMGFAPFARVVEGIDSVDSIYKVGEGFPRGPGPDQGTIQERGNAYLKADFPKLDYIHSATLK